MTDRSLLFITPRKTGRIPAWMTTLLLVVANPVATAGTFAEVTGFGSNPGNLRMFQYVPDQLQSPAPLVVALHGCLQDAATYGEQSGWIELADRWGFVLLLAEQKGFTGFTPWWQVNNPYRCFNWFRPGDTERERGEAFSIKQMIDWATADHAIAPNRIHVTGLSAGGAMTAVMLATYPEVFAGGAIIAGLPYHCAVGTYWFSRCMMPGRDKRPSEWGERVRNATDYSGPWPTVSIWHGTLDGTVAPLNARELLEQWTDVHSIDGVADTANTVKGYPHRVYEDTEGNALIETYLITGKGHGTPIDPGPAEEQCGVPGRFSLPVGICASFYIGKFWGLNKTE